MTTVVLTFATGSGDAESVTEEHDLHSSWYLRSLKGEIVLRGTVSLTLTLAHENGSVCGYREEEAADLVSAVVSRKNKTKFGLSLLPELLTGSSCFAPVTYTF